MVHVFWEHAGQVKVLEVDDGEVVEPRKALQERPEQ